MYHQALKIIGWLSDQGWEALSWFAQPPENTGGPALTSLICVLGLEYFLKQEAHYFLECSGWKKILVFHTVFSSASRSKFYQFRKRWFTKELKIYTPWASKGGHNCWCCCSNVLYSLCKMCKHTMTSSVPLGQALCSCPRLCACRVFPNALIPKTLLY